jgi:hypothetical protein
VVDERLLGTADARNTASGAEERAEICGVARGLSISLPDVAGGETGTEPATKDPETEIQAVQ